MSLPASTLRVFLSSTSVDLETYRDRVASLVQHGFGQFAVTMNTFPLEPHKDATTASLDQVRSCQVYLLLLAWRYGHVPTGAELSVTHQEYREAQRLGLPCFVFLADARTRDDLAQFPAESRDPGYERQLLAFRAEVQQHLVGYFASRDELVDQVTAALYTYLLGIGRPARIPRDLPPRAAGFVGRTTELETLLTTLRGGESVGLSALVSGLGGVGKSALAAEALARVAADPTAFPGGVTWLRCDTRTGLEGLTWVDDQLLAAWGVRLAAEALRGVGTEPEVQLVAREQALRERLGKLPGPALALLDNVEVDFPLERALDQLKPLGVRLLVTARHRPRLPGKLRLQTLETLDPEAGLALFVERYTAQEGAWVAARDAAAARVVVKRLGGLALAIELAGAAAAQPGQSVVGLAAEVQQPDVLARLEDPLRDDAGLRYSFGRSLALLTPQQRARFAAQGLPAGTDWPRPVIEALFAAVTASGPDADPDPPRQDGEALRSAREDLDRLVALSLVSLTRGMDPAASTTASAGFALDGSAGLVGAAEAGGAAYVGHALSTTAVTPRVRLHPLLRALAEEGWAREPEVLRQAGLRGLLRGVEMWAEAHQTKDAETYALLEADEPLIVGTLRAVVAAEAPTLRRRTAGGARHPDGMAGPEGQAGARMAAWLGDRDPATVQAPWTSGEARAALLAATHTVFVLAYYLNDGGHWRVGVKLWRLALRAARATGDRWNEGAILGNLANLVENLGDYAEAQRLHEQGLAISRAIGDQVGESADLHALGNLARRRGDYARARRLYKESLALDRQLGNRADEGGILSNLGLLAYQLGNYDEARRRYEGALAALREVGDPASEANVLGSLARMALAEGKMSEALALLDTALPLARASGRAYFLCFILTQQGEVARAERRWEEVARWLEEAEALNQRLGSREHAALLLEARGRLLRDQGQVEAARTLFTQALALFEALGEAYETGRVRSELAALDASSTAVVPPDTKEDPRTPDMPKRRRMWPWAKRH